MHITPEFMFDLESNMRLISERDYNRLTSNLWWNKIAKEMPSQSKTERINWLLETAKIEETIKGGGQAKFDEIVSRTTEYDNTNAAAGLKIKKEQLEDLDGNGVQLATHWSSQMGAYAAYWPQKSVANAIKANPVGYDGVTYFNGAHPLNPFDTGAGTYANLHKTAGGATGAGAKPIDTSVSVDAAVNNLADVLAYIATIKNANGEDPRMLRIAHLFVPPALTARAQQITNAQFIAQAASSGGGSANVEAVIRNFGLGQPVEVTELGAAFGGSDTTYYLGVQDIVSNELGAFVYVNREPFSIVFHGEMTDAELARKREFQWTTEGRNKVHPGHPYLLHECRAA
jgi:phage major head subunit gpT-like protein